MDGGHKKIISYFLRNGAALITPFLFVKKPTAFAHMA